MSEHEQSKKFFVGVIVLSVGLLLVGILIGNLLPSLKTYTVSAGMGFGAGLVIYSMKPLDYPWLILLGVAYTLFLFFVLFGLIFPADLVQRAIRGLVSGVAFTVAACVLRSVVLGRHDRENPLRLI